MVTQKAVLFFKLVDIWVGTPLCWLLGFISHRQPSSRFDPEKIHRILLVCWIGMGDVILTLPAVYALRRCYPNAHITYFTTPRAAAVLSGVSAVNQIINYDLTKTDSGWRGFWRTLRQLKQDKFDLSIDFSQRYRLPLLMTYWAGIPHRFGFALPGQGRQRLFTQTLPYIWLQHEAKMFGQLAQLAKAPPITGYLPTLQFPSDQIRLPFPLSQPFVVVHIGTGVALRTRQWGIDNFARLIDALQQQGYRVTITGASDERVVAHRILSQLSAAPINLVGQLSIPQLYHVFALAKLVISPDTGPMHLAAASGTPTLGIFLASYPEKWAPYGPRHQYIYRGPGINPASPRAHPPQIDIPALDTSTVINRALLLLANYN